MGVIIQRQVEAALSGVLFTVSPTDPGEMLLEYCGGMGEALVSGAVNPGRVSIRRPDRDTPPGAGSWTKTASPDDPAPAEAFLLNDVQIATLTRLALDIERAFGAPQDIEWTIDGDGRLVDRSEPADHRAEPKAAAGRRRRKSCGRTPTSTRTFRSRSRRCSTRSRVSGYYHYFRNLGRAFGLSRDRLALMEPALRQIIGVHGARMYYNLTSIHAVLRAAPFGELLAGVVQSVRRRRGRRAAAAALTGPVTAP